MSSPEKSPLHPHIACGVTTINSSRTQDDAWKWREHPLESEPNQRPSCYGLPNVYTAHVWSYPKAAELKGDTVKKVCVRCGASSTI